MAFKASPSRNACLLSHLCYKLRAACLALPALAASAVLATASANAQISEQSFGRLAANMYDALPVIEACKTGVLKASELNQALSTVNAIRQLHGLNPVRLDTTSTDEVMQASLLFAANGELEHEIPKNWKCYTSAGAKDAAEGLIGGGINDRMLRFYNTEETIVEWLTDVQNVADVDISHRRWLLNPFLKQIAYGRVAGNIRNGINSSGATLKVTYPDNFIGGSARQTFIAYPFENHPKKYFPLNAFLSFNALVNSEKIQENQNVSYANVSINIQRRSDKSQLKILQIKAENDYYGVPNNLIFKPNSLEYNTPYDVNISNVLVNGVAQSYSYFFNIVQ